MPRNSRGNTKQKTWLKLVEQLKVELPHLAAWWDDYDEFLELRLKARDDGTVLVIAKGFDSGGGPVVCFGTGYDVVSAIMAIDATINAGNWRVDKPWAPKKK